MVIGYLYLSSILCIGVCGIILLIKKLINSPNSKPASKSAQSTLDLTNVNPAKYSYKKRNLTIEIPNVPQDDNSLSFIIEENNRFLPWYFKVNFKQKQCFPLFLFHSESKTFPKIMRLKV